MQVILFATRKFSWNTEITALHPLFDAYGIRVLRSLQIMPPRFIDGMQ